MSAWATRETLHQRLEPEKVEGLLVASSIGDTVVGLSHDDLAHAVQASAAGLELAGLAGTDRVLIALNNDADLSGSVTATAAASVARAALSAGPRGRMRLLRLIESVQPNVLICTPCGAVDLLARMHMEFLVDPQELGLEKILLVGEITTDQIQQHLAAEFDAEVTELCWDPYFGILLGARRPGGSGYRLVDPGTAYLAGLDVEEPVSPDHPRELVVRPSWSSQLAGTSLRTGLLVDPDGGADGVPAVRHTVGAHVLIRGRWLSIPHLRTALKRIDGIASWSLHIARPGSLDKARLDVGFDRPSLAKNPMWIGRVEQLLRALTPVRIELNTFAFDEAEGPSAEDEVVDERGHHLGLERGAVSLPVA